MVWSALGMIIKSHIHASSLIFLVKYKRALSGPFPEVSFQDLKQYKKSDVAVQMQGRQKFQTLIAVGWGSQSGLR